GPCRDGDHVDARAPQKVNAGYAGIRTSRTKRPMRSRSAEVKSDASSTPEFTIWIHLLPRFRRASGHSRGAIVADPHICLGSAARDYPPRGHSRRLPSNPLSALSRRLDTSDAPRVARCARESAERASASRGSARGTRHEVVDSEVDEGRYDDGEKWLPRAR